MKTFFITKKKFPPLKHVFLLVLFLASFSSNGQTSGNFKTPETFFKMLKNKHLTYQQKNDNADAYFNKNGKEGMFKKYYKFYRRWDVRESENVGANGYVYTEDEANQALKKFNKTVSKSKSAKSQASKWKSVGPFKWKPGNAPTNPGIGRINNFAVEPNNQQLIYACSETGGIWKSTDAGQSWKPKGDDLEIMDIRGIGISPSDTNIVFIIDKNANILKSTNGADSWSKIFDGATNGVSGSDRPLSIIFDPNNSNVILISTGEGMLKSEDGGNSFKAYSKDIRFEDVLYKPGSSTIVYASGRAFHKSIDGGETFTEITSGIKYSGKERTKIAVSEADPEVVYMIQANVGGIQPGGGANYYQTMGAIYKSTDSGNNFSVVYDSRDSDARDLLDALAMRNMMIAVNNKDANMVFVGGQFAHYRSTDGAKSFKLTGDWSVDGGIVPQAYVHADIETGKYINGNMYIGSDGGFFRSKDNQDTFEDLTQNGISVRQFYKIGLCKSDPNLVGGGSQDNGMSILDISKNLSIEWEGGDGYEMLIDYEDPKILYATDLLSTSISRSKDGGITRTWLSGQPTGGSITAFAMDPIDHKVIYRGFSHNLYKNTNQGEKDAWTNLSSSVSSDTGRVNGLAISESNNNYIYIIKKKSSVEYDVWGTKNGQSTAPSWSKLYSTTSRINYISIDPNDPNRVALVTSFGKVELSTDAGTNWKNITRNLPGIVGKTLAFDNKSDNGLYVGMYKGIYYINDNMNEWIPFNNGFPNVRISEIEIHHSASKIVVGTYGRGAWEANLYNNDNSQEPPITNFTANITSLKEGESVNFTDQSTNSPTSWSWTFEGGTPVTSTDQNPSITYTTKGDYKVTLIAKNSKGDNTKVKENYITVQKANPDPTCTDGIQNGDETGVDCGGSCKPCNTDVTYCVSNGDNTKDEYISRVQLGSIDNVSDAGNGGYSDFTSISTVLSKGTPHTITITPKWTGTIYNEGYGVWIDYNQDGDFDDSDEQVVRKDPSKDNPVQGSFTIPSTAKDGNTRMRVSIGYETIPTACGVIEYGEVEDYTVTIGGSGDDTQAPSTPSNLSASNITKNSVSLSWTASTDNVKVTGYDIYQDNSMVTTVTGTSISITGLSADTTYRFKVKAKDAAGNMSGFSNTVDVNTAETGDSDICDGVAPWDSSIFYQEGDRMVYNENLHEMKANGNWANLGPCENGKNTGKNFSLVVSPVPVENLLNIKLNASKSSIYKILDLQGKIIKAGSFKPSVYVGNLKKGVYLIIINDYQNRMVSKTRFLKK